MTRGLAARGFVAALVALALGSAHPVRAASGEPPYATELARLAEILGSLHFLSGLCGGVSPWRDQMAALIVAENPDPAVRARLIDRFNVGLTSFGAVHRVCTDAARAAIALYRAEGEALTAAIAATYGGGAPAAAAAAR